MKRQHGFTLIEIITVVLIIGILVNVWWPNYVAIKKKAQAARIVGDFLLIRDAATMYYSRYGAWPVNREWGRAPKGLGQFLPEAFSWDLRPDMDVRYAWEDFGPAIGSKERDRRVVGVSVFSEDNALLKAVRAVYGGRTMVARGFGATARVIFMVQSLGRSAGREEGSGEDHRQ